MRVSLAVLGVLVLLGGSGLGAQSFQAFGARPAVTLISPDFADAELTGLLATLDRQLAARPAAGSAEESTATVLWQFARRLQSGRLSKSQERLVLDHLDRLARARPSVASIVSGPRRMISELTVGKVAPDIVGTDLDGKPLALRDYRNKVVVLVFSAEWCGICRAQAPYERFLLDRYANWPLALLGVQTGSSREAARVAQAARPLTHRSWWDAPGKGSAGGPIASAWNVVGWPASYVIDGDGIIRFVDLREEDLLKAVRQLVETQVDRGARTPARSR